MGTGDNKIGPAPGDRFFGLDYEARWAEITSENTKALGVSTVKAKRNDCAYAFHTPLTSLSGLPS